MKLPRALPAERFEESGHANAPSRARTARVCVWLGACFVVALFGAATLFVLWPLPDGLLDRRPASSLRILDRTGATLRSLRSAEEQDSVPLEHDRIPQWVRAAFVAAEDRRFNDHQGVDFRAIGRAVRDSLRAGRVVSGASTIPQQLARRLVPRDRSLLGKLQEALWALRLSFHLDKNALLVEYLNRVPLGHGTVGVEAASQFYFGVSSSVLSPARAALLAGLAHAPATEDPLRYPERALRRRDEILARMLAEGFLEDAVAERARQEALELVGVRSGQRAPHFTAGLVAGLEARGLAAAMEIETTLDPELQQEVEQIVREELDGPLARARVGQAAAVVIDNATGEILAWVGSRDFFDVAREGMNDGVLARRQPGSALKPFVYGLALADGMTPASVLPDVELTLATESGSYAPRNYDKRVHGPVRLRAALQNSYNIPAVHLAEVLTPARVLDMLHAAGFESLDHDAEHYGVGVVLGNGDVTLLELARAYRGLARGGVLEPLADIRAARDAQGALLPVPAALQPRRFLPARVVALLTDILVDEESRAPAFGLDNALALPFPTAAKTGTSRAYVDNWTAGFTKERTVAVWAGNFDGIPMRHVSGITGAGVIFRRVLLAAMRGVESAPLVHAEQFDTARICPLSGLLASSSCTGAFDEHFLPGTSPTRACDNHRFVARDSHDCARSKARALELSPRYAGWARAEGLALVGDARAEGRAVCGDAARADARPRLLSPTDGDEFAVEPGIPSGQGVPLRVDAPGLAVVELRTDDGQRIVLRPPFSTWLDARRGERRVSLYVQTSETPVDVAHFLVR